MTSIPEGFAPAPDPSAFNDLVGPLYQKIGGDRLVLGLLCLPKHANKRGVVHGGMLVTLADTVRPAQLVRKLELPEGAEASLLVEAAAVGNETWQLTISADDTPLLEATVTDTLFRKSVDLSHLAGKSVWLIARQSYTKGGDTHAQWKSLQLRVTEPGK